jgi:type II secretory ATPase GspE/PulE/Tfp pilus assembly ATPase PilB-like protein
MKNYFEENQFLLVRFCVVSCCCVLYGRKIQLNFIKFSGIIKMEVMRYDQYLKCTGCDRCSHNYSGRFAIIETIDGNVL